MDCSKKFAFVKREATNRLTYKDMSSHIKRAVDELYRLPYTTLTLLVSSCGLMSRTFVGDVYDSVKGEGWCAVIRRSSCEY